MEKDGRLISRSFVPVKLRVRNLTLKGTRPESLPALDSGLRRGLLAFVFVEPLSQMWKKMEG